MDNRLYRYFLIGPLLLAVLLCGAARADQTFSQRLRSLVGAESSQNQPLDPGQAFRLHTQADGARAIRVTWNIADGYYLYRDKFSFHVISAGASVQRGGVQLPPGRVKQDPAFGKVVINTGLVDVRVPLVRAPGPALPVTLKIGYQGCEDGVVCYPPISRRIALVLPALSSAGNTAPNTEPADSGSLGRTLARHGLLFDGLTFFGFGLLLAFTPCVFPMIPILSGIIVGQGVDSSVPRATLLSLSYVLSMALVYAALGVVAGLLNFNLQAAAQNPWVISVFSGLFVVLALSMFGLFQMQWPEPVRGMLAGWSNRVRGGSLHGAALMGGLSALIVGPCVAPPLAAALLYISQTGNAVLGGAALFLLGLGMGTPLVALGASGGALLPRAGRWMESVKHVFGVIMLGVAVEFLGRVLPPPLMLGLWGLLLIVSAVYMGALDRVEAQARWRRLWKGLGIAMLLYGAALLVGAASGGDDVWRPLQPLAAVSSREPLPFHRVTSVGGLQEALKLASRQGRPVMLDFYADWCVECKEMDRHTFPDPKVRAMLKNMVLLKADVTAYASDADARQLLGHFKLVGPPAILFFNSKAQELKGQRVIGFLSAKEFVRRLRALLRT